MCRRPWRSRRAATRLKVDRRPGRAGLEPKARWIAAMAKWVGDSARLFTRRRGSGAPPARARRSAVRCRVTATPTELAIVINTRPWERGLDGLETTGSAPSAARRGDVGRQPNAVAQRRAHGALLFTLRAPCLMYCTPTDDCSPSFTRLQRESPGSEIRQTMPNGKETVLGAARRRASSWVLVRASPGRPC